MKHPSRLARTGAVTEPKPKTPSKLLEQAATLAVFLLVVFVLAAIWIATEGSG